MSSKTTPSPKPAKKPKNIKLILSWVFGILGIILLAVSLYLIFYSYQQIRVPDTNSANTAALAAFGVGIAGALFTIIAWILNFVFSPAAIVFGLISFALLALAIYLMFLTHQKIEAGDPKDSEAAALSAFIIGIIAGIGVIITWILIFVFGAGRTYVESQQTGGGTGAGASGGGGGGGVDTTQALLALLA